MDHGLFDHVKKRMRQKQKHHSIVKNLVRKGYHEAHIRKVIAVLNTTEKTIEKRDENEAALIRKFMIKEVLDKIAFGFGSQQFINILFALAGASYFLIGLVNGFNVVASLLMSLVLRDYLRVHDVSKKLIVGSGVFFGAMFFLISVAAYIGSISFFVAAFLLSALGVVFLGDIYVKEYSESLKKEKIGYALSKMTQFGIVIITFSLVLSAYIMDYFGIEGKEISFFGIVPGYLISFLITAICFIASTIVLHSLKRDIKTEGQVQVFVLVKEQIAKAWKYLKLFAQDKAVLLVLIASTLTGFAQTMGNTYYGIFIFREFGKHGFGGFMNVAMIFIVAIISAMFAPTIAKMLSKKYGNVPMLVMGTLLLAILPLTYYFRPSLTNIAMATVSGIIGSAIAGLATGLLISNRLPEAEREAYYNSYSVIVTIPYLILFPAAAWLADVYALKVMFLVIGAMLALVVMPLYFALLFVERQKVL